MENMEKFASQAKSDVLAAMREIAKEDGRHFQAVLDEAMCDYIEKKRAKPRTHVKIALQESISKFDDLYKELATQMTIAEKIMKEDYDTLKKLSES